MVLSFVALASALLAPPDGEAVIRAAHAKYAGKWHTTLTFVQKTTFPTGRVETWYEAMEIPGKLRIDVAPLSSGRSMIFRNDSLYQFAAGKMRGNGIAYVHSMLVLLDDLHVLAPDLTIAKLKGLGFDLAKTRETTWNGKAVFVVGAAAGDTTSAQFWIEKERMLLVRLIEPNAQAPARSMDAHFVDYQKVGNGWVEGKVLIHLGGKLAQTEEYTQVKAGMTHEAGLFDPSNYKASTWVGNGEEVFKP